MNGPRTRLKNWIMDRHNDGKMPGLIVALAFKVFNLKGL